jgi:hypothetical protein
MKIRDIKGSFIEVTDLDQAIKQAKDFKDMKHEDESFAEFDKKQQAYWTDMYNKLIALKT